ncbi:MAG: TM0106 family RecB-like putative nuclease [Arachnia sp.]
MTDFALDPYAARSCPVKVHNWFDPTLPAPGPLDESLRESFQGGREFRHEVIRRIPGTNTVRIQREDPDAHRATMAAMAAGVPVIVHPRLPDQPHEHRSGQPDVLVRGDASPTGGPGYWPLRIKPYRLLERQLGGTDLLASDLASLTELRPLPDLRYRVHREGALLELAHFYRMLQALGYASASAVGGAVGLDGFPQQQDRPIVAWIPLDLKFIRTFSRTSPTGHRQRSALDRYDHEHGFRVYVAQQAMRRTGEGDPPAVVRPIRVRECEWCAWWETCRPRMDDDDLSLRISKTPLDVRELQTLMSLGIHTVTQLAQADIEALLPDYLPATAHRDRSEQRLRQAARRARMLAEGVELEKITDDPVRLPRAGVEVDLDIETDDSGRTYLWGALVSDRRHEHQEYVHFSRFESLSITAEAALAGQFSAWLLDLLRRHPETLVYHYSDYETITLGRIAGRGLHPATSELFGLVGEHFVDMFRSVRDHFVGVEGLGLKVVASKGAGFAWRDEEPGGLASQSWFATAAFAESAAERDAARRRVLEYNEDDVRATWEVREWLERIDAEAHEA